KVMSVRGADAPFASWITRRESTNRTIRRPTAGGRRLTVRTGMCFATVPAIFVLVGGCSDEVWGRAEDGAGFGSWIARAARGGRGEEVAVALITSHPM